MDPTENRLIEIETKFAFLEETVDQLNGVILEQGREIASLRRQISELEGRVAAKQDGGPEGETDPLEERPPHY